MSTADTIYQFSGLIDSRNACHIERDEQTRKPVSVDYYPNIDMLYGVYKSKEEAFEALSATNKQGVNALVKGKTVGIEQNGKIVEYWFESQASSIDDLVVKGRPEVEIDLSLDADTLWRKIYNSPKNALYTVKTTEGYYHTASISTDGDDYLISYELKDTDVQIRLTHTSMDMKYVEYYDTV